MNAISLDPLPNNVAIQVQPMDNSDQNMVLQADFERALKNKGFAVSTNSKLLFTFETRDEIGAWSTTDRRHILSLESRGGRGGGENAKARVNVFDSASGGLFNRGHGGTTITTPSQYRIDVTVEDRDTGKRFWQAWSIGKLGAGDGLSLTRKMVPVLVEGIGQTIRKKPFDAN